jgi:hypothetical protein
LARLPTCQLDPNLTYQAVISSNSHITKLALDGVVMMASGVMPQPIPLLYTCQASLAIYKLNCDRFCKMQSAFDGQGCRQNVQMMPAINYPAWQELTHLCPYVPRCQPTPASQIASQLVLPSLTASQASRP